MKKQVQIERMIIWLTRLMLLAMSIYAAPLFFVMHYGDPERVTDREYIQRAQRTLINANNRIKCVLFSPDDAIHEILIGLISAAEYRIYIAVFVLTDKRIAEALMAAQRRGVRIEIVVCRTGIKDQWSKVDQLRAAGIPVYVYPSAYTKSLMHNKFIVFQRVFNKTVLATGSFNLTRSAAQSNQENMIFWDDSEIAKQYISRFESLKRLSILLK